MVPGQAHLVGIVAELGVEACLPLTPLTSRHARDLGGAQRVEAVRKRDADVDFVGLSSGSREAVRSPKDVSQCILASILLRT